MAKRGEYERDSEWVEDEVEAMEVIDIPLPLEAEPTTARIILLRDVNLKIYGPVTHKLYTANGAGSIMEVDVEDASQLLEKTSGKSCCSGNISRWFERA